MDSENSSGRIITITIGIILCTILAVAQMMVNRKPYTENISEQHNRTAGIPLPDDAFHTDGEDSGSGEAMVCTRE